MHQPTPATIIATVALFFSLTGVGAATYLANTPPQTASVLGSVVTAQSIREGLTHAIKPAYASCPGNDALVSGGWESVGATTLADSAILVTGPRTVHIGPYSATAWEVVVQNNGPLPVSFRAIAVCEA